MQDHPSNNGAAGADTFEVADPDRLERDALLDAGVTPAQAAAYFEQQATTRSAHDLFAQLDRIEKLVHATAMRVEQLDALLARYQPLLERAERRAARTSFFAPREG